MKSLLSSKEIFEKVVFANVNEESRCTILRTLLNDMKAIKLPS